MKKRKLLVAMSVSFLVIIATISTAVAHYNTGIYIYNSSLQQKDPVNVTFYDEATAASTETHINHHQGFTEQGGSKMWFWDHGSYWQTPRSNGFGRQLASACLPCARDHVRFSQGYDTDVIWGTYTSGAIHYEIIRYCGHVVNDFDGPRNIMANVFWLWNEHGPSNLWANANNTSPSPQCDGSMPKSIDGKIAWIKIP